MPTRAEALCIRLSTFEAEARHKFDELYTTVAQLVETGRADKATAIGGLLTMDEQDVNDFLVRVANLNSKDKPSA